MIRFADPSGQFLSKVMYGLGFGNAIYPSDQTNAVQKYLKESRKRKEKFSELCPKCMQIVNQEMTQMQWTDTCFQSYVSEMFAKSEVSQLETFYHRYRASRNKSQFFLYFVKYEL